MLKVSGVKTNFIEQFLLSSKKILVILNYSYSSQINILITCFKHPYKVSHLKIKKLTNK